jgi:hypothetical protein
MSGSNRIALCAALAMLQACGSCGAFQGNVQHPHPGAKNTAAYCAAGNSQEQNCSYCAAKPGCGFCATPLEGAALCQPGVVDDLSPSSCAAPLIVDTSSCPAPPPPL